MVALNAVGVTFGQNNRDGGSQGLVGRTQAAVGEAGDGPANLLAADHDGATDLRARRVPAEGR